MACGWDLRSVLGGLGSANVICPRMEFRFGRGLDRVGKVVQGLEGLDAVNRSIWRVFCDNLVINIAIFLIYSEISSFSFTFQRVSNPSPSFLGVLWVVVGGRGYGGTGVVIGRVGAKWA